LVRVLAQIRFPTLLSIAEAATVAPFQERIRSAYPIAENQIIQRVVIALGTESPAVVQAERIWRFRDREKSWRVSLAPTFLALETDHYTHRREFLERMSWLIEALEQTLNPRVTQRLGLRYIDRIESNAIGELHELIKPDFLGPSRSVFGEATQYILTESVLNTAEGASIAARWGMLPPQASFDPNVLEPIEGNSWILDLDMYSDAQTDLSVDALLPQLEQFAERIYAVFRFMVTERFLTYYGGDPR